MIWFSGFCHPQRGAKHCCKIRLWRPACRASARWCCDCRHHKLHEYIQSNCDAGCRFGSKEGNRVGLTGNPPTFAFRNGGSLICIVDGFWWHVSELAALYSWSSFYLSPLVQKSSPAPADWMNWTTTGGRLMRSVSYWLTIWIDVILIIYRVCSERKKILRKK